MPKKLYSAIEQIISLMVKAPKGSRVEGNSWDKLVKNCDPNGTVGHKYTDPVRDSICVFLKKTSEADKRMIWKDSKAGEESELCDGIHISAIEMDLEEELFAQVVEVAFEQSEEHKH
jgi:hypothetical protein